MKTRRRLVDEAETGGCPLCLASGVRPFARVQHRRYLECAACGLVHLEAGQRLGSAAEKAHYLTHENDPADDRYRAFLSRLVDPLVARLTTGAEGLDFGSGPGPTLSLMLAERGFPTAVYDPYFAHDEGALQRTYDFVTCTETAEHFFHPADELALLGRLLRPGGWLAIMTQAPPERSDFERWRYARDPTHVCFYRPRTMEWIAGRFGWSLEIPHPNVTLFRKPAAVGTSPA